MDKVTWRSFLGWGLAWSVVYQLILQPAAIMALLFIDHNFPADKLPKLELQQLINALLALIGLG